MRLDTPQVELFSITVIGKPKEYLLHAITYCKSTNFRAAGFRLHSDEPDENNVFKVDLIIEEDLDIPSLPSITPVNHIISFGAVPFEDDRGIFEVKAVFRKAVFSRDPDDPPEEEDGGSTSSGTTGANEVDRPIEKMNA